MDGVGAPTSDLMYQDSDIDIHPGTAPLSEWQPRADQADADADKKAPVAQQSASYAAMAPVWRMLSTVLAGTLAMRAAAEDYLPKHEYESIQSYNDRCKRSVLDNYTLRTLETLVGKAFRDPPQFMDDVPSQISDLFPDMDGRGNPALAVAQKWFRTGVSHAIGYLWVDFTRGQPRQDGQPRTLADDLRDGARPYWKLVRPEDVWFQQGYMEGGKYTLTQVRMYEPSMEADGDYGERLVERIRVLRPYAWELWEKRQIGTTKRWKWVNIDGGDNPLGYVPIVSYYTDEEGLGEGKPPLEDLAHLNVTHFQSGSDQRNILTVARFPMLAVSGANAQVEKGDKPLVVGPNQWLSVTDPQGKFYYVEHTGKAIEAGRNDLKDLEQRMSSYGAEFMKKQASRASATGRQLDTAEAVSLLQSWCYGFRDALIRALQITADWLQLASGGNVQFEVEATVDASDQFELATLTAMRARADISREGFANELKRRGILPDEFDPEDDLELLQSEPPLGGALGGMFGTPDAPTVGTTPTKESTEPSTTPKED